MAEEQGVQQQPNPKRMNPEVKAKWLEALRSGNYQKTKAVLKRANIDGSIGYCCLGVLCEISGKGQFSYDTSLGCFSFTGSFGAVQSMPPSSVCEWAGLQEDFSLDVPNLLARMNDDGKSFVEIADWIEQNL